MPKATATALSYADDTVPIHDEYGICGWVTAPKATLVIIATQAGPQPQIWYDDGGRTVGPPIKPIASFPLPAPPHLPGWWRIDDAIAHVASKLYPQPNQLHNPIGDHSEA